MRLMPRSRRTRCFAIDSRPRDPRVADAHSRSSVNIKERQGADEVEL